MTVWIAIQTTDDPTVYGVPKLAPTTAIKTAQKGKIDLSKFVDRVAAGFGTGNMSVFVEGVDGVKASGTVTVDTGNASAGDYVELAGHRFTFRAAGTTDPTDLTQVDLGSTALLTATNLVTKANLTPQVRGIGSCAVSGTTTGILTWTANYPGQAANTYGTIVVSGANLARSGATIASGTESTFYSAGYFPGDGG